MSTYGAPLGLRLFLEGIEVPVISAQITIQPSQSALCSIQIIPTNASMTFKPRTLVHLFYLDTIADSDIEAARGSAADEQKERENAAIKQAKHGIYPE